MLRTIARTPKVFTNLQNKITFPAKFKGTILEKWANYWKNLFIDYRQMLQDLRTDVQDDPRKAFKWTLILTGSYGLASKNPTEVEFQNNLISISNEVILVNEECQNLKSVEHLHYLQRCNNEGVLHYKSFGLFSVMYTSNLNNSCDLFKAQCSYLEPSYLDRISQVVDVGFMGQWWNLFIKTTNYDVNM